MGQTKSVVQDDLPQGSDVEGELDNVDESVDEDSGLSNDSSETITFSKYPLGKFSTMITHQNHNSAILQN